MVENQNKQILKVAHSFPVWLPQTQTWMYSQVKELQNLDVEAHVICERIYNIDQFEVANLHSFENKPVVRQVWEKGLRKLGIRHHLDYLVEVAKKTDARLIHSHFGDFGWTNLGAIRKLKVKHVVTFYGLDVNKVPVNNPIWLRRYNQLFAEVDLVLCEGSHMAECVSNLGCPDHKVKVQHLGVDVDNIPFKPRQWCEGEPLRVLIAASFREKKGIPFAIKALEIIARKIPVLLTIIGDASQNLEGAQEKKRIIAALESSGLKDHTRLLGYQSHKAMMKEAYENHLFLQPSITAHDGDTEGGAPVSIIEMIATGMPVVATTHCDIPEVVGPDLSHLLAPERDIEKLAECIQLLLNDPDSWLKLTQKGRRHVECDYHRVRQAESLMNRYNEIL